MDRYLTNETSWNVSGATSYSATELAVAVPVSVLEMNNNPTTQRKQQRMIQSSTILLDSEKAKCTRGCFQRKIFLRLDGTQRYKGNRLVKAVPRPKDEEFHRDTGTYTGANRTSPGTRGSRRRPRTLHRPGNQMGRKENGKISVVLPLRRRGQTLALSVFMGAGRPIIFFVFPSTRVAAG